MDKKRTVTYKNGARGFFKKVSSLKFLLIGIALIIVVSVSPVYAQSITKPYDFYDGDVISAAEMNANFDTVYTKVNELDALTSYSAVRVYSSGTITLPTGVPVSVF